MKEKKYYILYMGAKGMIYVIKKDGTREEFNSQKIVAAVNKSAARILYTFSDKEKEFICQFAEEHEEDVMLWITDLKGVSDHEGND